MALDILFENFSLLMDAPNSVQKMRELILQMAVQGKLVSQDANDEPTSELLKRIKADKERLIKEKKIKKSKPLPPIDLSKVAYDTPDSWEWIYLDHISNVVHYGYTASADKNIRKVRLLRITDIQNGMVNWEQVPGCEINRAKFQLYELNVGDLLIARTGGTIGKTFLVEDLPVQAVFASYLIRVVPNINVSPNYMKVFVQSPLYWNQLHSKSSGTGQPNVNATSLKSLVLPLPPVKEQKRIVAKVDQLMALCDELESRQQKAVDKRTQLNDSAIYNLLAAQDADEFADHWQLISENYDLLFDDSENIDKLRKAILQLAVQGKLVSQDENDEPASELLKRIKAEKDRLIKEGKIKKSKPSPPVDLGEVSYALPNNWKWTRLNELGIVNPRNDADDDLTVSFVPMALISSRYGEKASTESRKWCEIKAGFTHFADNDIVSAKITPCFQNGKAAVIGKLKNRIGAGTTELHVFRPITEDILSDFVYIYLKSPKFILEGISKMTGSAGQKRVPKSYFAQNPFPLPPLSEQKRIVSKVDQLMALCDKLEAQLTQSQNDSGKLLDAVLHDALAA